MPALLISESLLTVIVAVNGAEAVGAMAAMLVVAPVTVTPLRFIVVFPPSVFGA